MELDSRTASAAHSINLSNYRFIHPLAIGFLALRTKYRKVELSGFSGPVSSFLSRMGFYSYCGIDDRHRIRGKDLAKTIEIHSITNLDGVLTKLRRLLRGDPSLRTIELILVELSANVELHSKGEGVIVGQVIKGRIELAVVDNGIGVWKSLTQNPEYADLEESTALKLSVQKGVTAGTGRGWGLWSAYEVLRQNRGAFTIGSGGYRYTLQTGRSAKTPGWNGTYVDLKYDLKRPIDYSQATGMAKSYQVPNEDDFPF